MTSQILMVAPKVLVCPWVEAEVEYKPFFRHCQTAASSLYSNGVCGMAWMASLWRLKNDDL